MVSACLPCIRPIFPKILPSFFSPKKDSRRDINVGMEGSRQSDGTPLKKLGLGVARGGEFQRLSDREGRGEEGGQGGGRGGRGGRRREEGRVKVSNV